MSTTSLMFDIIARDRASDTFDKVGRSAGKSMTTLRDKVHMAGDAAGKVLVGGLVAGGAALVKMGQAAATDEAAQVKLARQLVNSAGATRTQTSAVEEWIAAQGRALGVTDDELRPALSRLVTATGDVDEAQRLAALAMDASAGTGKSLKTVAEALGKAQDGNVSALSRLGIATKNAKGETLSFDQVTRNMATTFRGQAAAAADTAAGKQQRLTVALGELGEQIGAVTLPAMVRLSAAGLKSVGWISENTTKVGVLVGVLGGLLALVWGVSAAMRVWGAMTAVATGAQAAYAAVVGISTTTLGTWVGVKYLELAAWTRTTAATVASTVATGAHAVMIGTVAAATKVWAGVQWALNAAMTANPIGLVVAALVVLGAGLVVAYKRSETFRKIVNSAFAAVRNVAGAVVGWLGKTVPQVWRAIASAAKVYLGIYRNVIVTAFNVVRKTVGAVMSAVRSVVTGAWRGITTVVRTAGGAIVSVIRAIPGKIRSLGGAFASAGRAIIGALVNGLQNAGGVIGGIAGNVWSAVKGMLNGAIGRINSALTFTISLPGPDISVNPPNIPYLAKGTRSFPGGLAVVGEEGPELVRLPRGASVTSNAELTRNGLTPVIGGADPGGRLTVNIRIDGSKSPELTGRAVVQAIKKYKRELGNVELGIA